MKFARPLAKNLFDKELKLSDEEEHLSKITHKKARIRENVMKRFNEDTESHKRTYIDLCNDNGETDHDLTTFRDLDMDKAKLIIIHDNRVEKKRSLNNKLGSQDMPIIVDDLEEKDDKGKEDEVEIVYDYIEDQGIKLMEIEHDSDNYYNENNEDNGDEVDSLIDDEEQEEESDQEGEWVNEQNNEEDQQCTNNTVMRSQRLEEVNMRNAFKLLEAGNYQAFLDSKIIQKKFIDAFDLIPRFGHAYGRDTIIEAWNLHWEGRLIIREMEDSVENNCCFCNLSKNVRICLYEDSVYGRLVGIAGTTCHPRFKALMALTDVCYELLQSVDDQAFESIAHTMLEPVLRNVLFAKV